MDGAVALQPAHGPAAARQPAARLRVGVLQAGLRPLQPAPRRRRHRVQAPAAVALPADLPQAAGSATARTRWSRCRCSTRRRRSTATSTPSRSCRRTTTWRRCWSACASTPSGRRSICSTSARRTIRSRCRARIRAEWPRISGVHGVFKHLDAQMVGGKLVEGEALPEFDQAQLDRLRARQIEAVRYLDGVFERLFDLLPPHTYVTVTSDHGELFGEQRLLRPRADPARQGVRGAVGRGAAALRHEASSDVRRPFARFRRAARTNCGRPTHSTG